MVLAVAVLAAASPAAADRSGTTTNDQIARLYLGVFGRSPDLGGEAYWNHRVNDGTTLDRVADVFVDSPEFGERFGTGNDAVLNALYRNVLGREPDAGGFAWWTDQLNQGRELSDVVRNFTESPENIANAVDEPSRYDAAPTDVCDTPVDDYLQAYLAQMDETVTIAVHDVRNDCFYGVEEDQVMTTASTFKLAVMGAMVLRAQDQGRSLTAAELEQLDGMIRFSDDPDVRPIINSMGGSDGMLSIYGDRLGISSWVDATAWGCVAWSAKSATALIEQLTLDSPELDNPAFDLLTSVTPSQTWGVGDGTNQAIEGATVAQKNGFAPSCGSGSRINSVGMVFDADGAPAYSIAIYSTGWVHDVLASRANDQPAYVLEARDHVNHIAEHIGRLLGP